MAVQCECSAGHGQGERLFMDVLTPQVTLLGGKGCMATASVLTLACDQLISWQVCHGVDCS